MSSLKCSPGSLRSVCVDFVCTIDLFATMGDRITSKPRYVQLFFMPRKNNLLFFYIAVVMQLREK